jgi:hypothetical protein
LFVKNGSISSSSSSVTVQGSSARPALWRFRDGRRHERLSAHVHTRARCRPARLPSGLERPRLSGAAPTQTLQPIGVRMWPHSGCCCLRSARLWARASLRSHGGRDPPARDGGWPTRVPDPRLFLRAPGLHVGRPAPAAPIAVASIYLRWGCRDLVVTGRLAQAAGARTRCDPEAALPRRARSGGAAILGTRADCA